MSARRPIRDRQGRILGHVEGPDSLGRARLLDYGNRTLGWHFSDRGYTVDNRNRVIGNGDQLLRLLR